MMKTLIMLPHDGEDQLLLNNGRCVQMSLIFHDVNVRMLKTENSVLALLSVVLGMNLVLVMILGLVLTFPICQMLIPSLLNKMLKSFVLKFSWLMVLKYLLCVK